MATAYLAGVDSDLASLIEKNGMPPLWEREPGFATLVHIILEQQVSLASARAAYDKLQRELDEVLPERLLSLEDHVMKAIGFSRQKMRYSRLLASAILEGSFDLDGLPAFDDDTARKRLMALKGVGKWTADVYLMMALRRRDVWPEGDLALAVAVQHVKCLDERPEPGLLSQIAAPWRPWRAIAARVLWNHYLTDIAHRKR